MSGLDTTPQMDDNKLYTVIEDYIADLSKRRGLGEVAIELDEVIDALNMILAISIKKSD